MALSCMARPLVALVLYLALLPVALSTTTEYITYQDNNGQKIYLADNRKPALYTGNFGSCLGESLIDVTRFDASYYHDNMTIIFDIQGSTNLTRDAVMIYIGVFAYGETRFELPFDPCKANIYSMCPVRHNVSITASGQIPLAQSDIAMIPNIAYSIPDFEGQAILRIFSNTTQSEIACYSAVVTNGATFSQPKAIGSILGIFAFIAVVASFVTAIYGSDVVTMRMHYAHSLSVLVVFSVYQHIFFTGALSMNWPSVLPAFWSNYAWAAGIINTKSMQESFNKLTSNHRGNTSMLGAAGTDTWASDVGGGYDIHQIYKRALSYSAPTLSRTIENMLAKRASSGNDNVTATKYMGHLVPAGLSLPGNYSGFPGTLYPEEIPASNAFLTGFVWFLILILVVGGGVLIFKCGLEVLYQFKLMKTERFNYFRKHYWGYLAVAIARTCFIAFFSMMFYTIFQFSYGGATAVLAIAAVVFVIFFAGIFGIVGYACYYKLRFDTWDSIRARYERITVLGFIPWYRTGDFSTRNAPASADTAPTEEKKLGVDGNLAASDDKISTSPNSTWTTHHSEFHKSVHDDEDFTKKFGWLASRHRKSKWWFFAAWTVYEFVRACFFAGASGYAMVQVFGLLVVEFIAFMVIIRIRPFEGQRLNVLMVYLLGFSKVSTVALSAAFDVTFNIGRITTTAIGIVIIVIQGIVTIVLMICIVLSAITSYFSVMRYREEIRPKKWNPYRERYFKHLDRAVRDRPRTPPPALPTPPPEEPKGPYFSVNSVRRAPKIEDEDPEFLAEIARDPRLSVEPVDTTVSVENTEAFYRNHPAASGSRMSRAMSTSSRRSTTGLPYAARVHRGSWSTRDFSEFTDGFNGVDGTTTPRRENDPFRPASRQYPLLNTRISYDNLSKPVTAGAQLRNAQYAEDMGRSSTGSPNHHSSPASPSISRTGSLRESTPIETTTQHISPSRESAKPSLTPINTAITRSIENMSPSSSPRTPPRTRSRLQKHRQGESIDEVNEG
ncbi:uncharacterized protein PV09_00474 [Verruconis gallopava]|uniref:ML-like domain-containing protein n=1 Tax=Verruconis gallopava TaxID=253628 RepID=A0A0D1Y3V3_9PEZI|nr:uncharacterized protein PV09_00474 [Verruconis gallopava]KIW09606.1 hypothetical protein PV09_00474 [Verruconis gallopava]